VDPPLKERSSTRGRETGQHSNRVRIGGIIGREPRIQRKKFEKKGQTNERRGGIL